MNPFVSMFRSMDERVRAGQRVAFCVVLSTHGSVPQAAGAAMLVRQEGEIEGTLGGGFVEAEVRRKAGELLSQGQSALLDFNLDDAGDWGDGLICGGRMRIAVMPMRAAEELAPFVAAADALEAGRAASVPVRVAHEGHAVEYRLHIEPPARLIIAGAGHVGTEVAKLAIGLDFETIVVDDRPEFANRERLPEPIAPIVGDIAGTLREMAIDGRTFVVIVTRGHKHDEDALAAVIDRPAGYLGMIGSRRKIKVIFDHLAAAGVSQTRLAEVHSPIGLPIGGVTVPEIAVSIAAELIQVRRGGGKPTHVEGPIDVATGGRA